MLPARPCVLLTGFEPFGGDAINPSWLAARALHGRQIAGHRVISACLPTAFGTSAQALAALLREHRPALVLCLGLAAGRSALSLERVAINVDDARIADNAGAQPVDRPVVARAPAAYFARLPLKAMLQAMRTSGVPAELSNTAGTFVCNHVFFALMHQLAAQRGRKTTLGGFMHLPALPEQVLHDPDMPAMALEDMVRGLRAAVRAALVHGNAPDLPLAAGATH